MNLQEIIDLHNRGIIVNAEACGQICRSLTEENADDLLANVELLKVFLAGYLAKLPDSDAEWSKFRTLYIGSWIGHPEEWRKAREQDSQDFRRGVEILRKRLAQ